MLITTVSLLFCTLLHSKMKILLIPEFLMRTQLLDLDCGPGVEASKKNFFGMELVDRAMDLEGSKTIIKTKILTADTMPGISMQDSPTSL